MAKSGEKCCKCDDGYYIVYATLRTGDTQKRYLKCGRCSHRPGKETVLAESVRRPMQRRTV